MDTQLKYIMSLGFCRGQTLLYAGRIMENTILRLPCRHTTGSFLRCADTLAGIADAEEVTIWHKHESDR